MTGQWHEESYEREPVDRIRTCLSCKAPTCVEYTDQRCKLGHKERISRNRTNKLRYTKDAK
ncbi:hypothetical protein LCGC14_1331790 [marine sediment metagenome]|uniref:Uncharacterized protein n=1 Tax=marine sediment metagenome TaxID=412755 RepID=A0A0F9NIR9_9ZZZZ